MRVKSRRDIVESRLPRDTDARLHVSDRSMASEVIKTVERDRPADASYLTDHLKIGIASLQQLINKGVTVKHLEF